MPKERLLGTRQISPCSHCMVRILFDFPLIIMINPFSTITIFFIYNCIKNIPKWSDNHLSFQVNGDMVGFL